MGRQKPIERSRGAVNLSVLRFDRTAALIDARVEIENVNIINVPGGKVGVEGFLSGAFDAADVPFARYVFWKASGKPVTAIPVFTDRIFQHQYIYTRPDTGIRGLADLRGRRVMCAPSYFSTPSFWHRALLCEECGIKPSEIDWYSAFPESGGMSVPDNVTVTLCPASMLGIERLLDGSVDCLMTARTAIVAQEDLGRVQRVIADASAQQREWVRRTGYFPIAHVLAIHNDVVEANPDLLDKICRGFDQAKSLAYQILQDERMTALPLMRSYLDDTVEVWGDDPWPYGYEPNKEQITRFLGYAYDQGLTDRQLSVDELFDNRSTEYKFEAKMVPGCITGIMDGGWALESEMPSGKGQHHRGALRLGTRSQ